MNVADIIDAALPAPHGNRQGLSSGQLKTLWLTHILTQYNHRMCPVEAWARERRRTLEHATGWTIGDKDLTDDRLADVLSALGGSAAADATATPAETIELALGQHLIRAYALPTAVARLDTTSVSVYHNAQDRDDQPRTLLHYGHSKEGHPERRQFIQALGTLDPVTRLGLRDAVSHYRGQWQPERGFHRFKSGIMSALPIYLDDETRIRSSMLVLGMALRFLTLVEFVVRQALVNELTEVAGLYGGNPKRKTKQLTTERLLKALQNITLYCVEVEGRQIHHLTALSDLQKHLLRWMSIPETIYALPAPDG